MRNCFLNVTLSKAEVNNGKLSLEAHFIRPFKTMDVWTTDEDLQLEVGGLYGVQLRVKVPNKQTLSSYVTMDLGELEEQEKETHIRRRRLNS